MSETGTTGAFRILVANRVKRSKASSGGLSSIFCDEENMSDILSGKYAVMITPFN